MTGFKNARLALGFTLIELLVVIAIIGVLVGLILPAVQKIRAGAARTECINKLRQLAVGALQAHDTRGCLFPAYGYYGPNVGTWAYHILPFVEQQSVYEKNQVPDGQLHATVTVTDSDGAALDNPGGGSASFPTQPGSYDMRIHPIKDPIKLLVCPEDGGANDPNFLRNYARYGVSPPGSYGGNILALGDQHRLAGTHMSTGNYTTGLNLAAPGVKFWQGQNKVPSSFPDGTSTTILFIEKLAVCNSEMGGNMIFRCRLDPWQPAVGVWVHGHDALFQANPQPYTGNACNPLVATSGHVGGIHAAMVDGSVHFFRTGMNGDTFWALMTPSGGEVVSLDW